MATLVVSSATNYEVRFMLGEVGISPCHLYSIAAWDTTTGLYFARSTRYVLKMAVEETQFSFLLKKQGNQVPNSCNITPTPPNRDEHQSQFVFCFF